MSKLYKVPPEFAANARIRHDDYVRMYQESVKDPEEFWGRMAGRIDWLRPFGKVKDVSPEDLEQHARAQLAAWDEAR